MAFSPAPASAEAHLVLYDGVCGLCSRLLRFVLRHDHRAVFDFASLQSAAGKAMVARWGGNPEELTSFYVVADFRTPGARMLMKSDAALFVAGELGWPWRAARAAHILPGVIRDRLYDVIARHRYRVFGRHEQCLVPSPEFRHRFIDQPGSPAGPSAGEEP
jgi:predicted DCC family thiol-disulfide oxidoreductase YuxK